MVQNKTSKIRTIIIEDHIGSLIKLKSLIKDFDYIEIIGEAKNGKNAVELIDAQKPDLIVLDIELPGMNGFEVLEKIKFIPQVIFTTAYDKYAVKAFEVNGVDYILKPVLKDRLKIALEKVIKQNQKPGWEISEVLKYLSKMKNQSKRFSIKKDDQILIIPAEQVYYFKSEDRYVFLCTYDKYFFYNSTLKKLEKELNSEQFFRINKSNIISLDKIVKLKKNYLHEYKVILNDKRKSSLKVSRKCLAKLKEKLGII